MHRLNSVVLVSHLRADEKEAGAIVVNAARYRRCRFYVEVDHPCLFAGRCLCVLSEHVV